LPDPCVVEQRLKEKHRLKSGLVPVDQWPEEEEVSYMFRDIRSNSGGVETGPIHQWASKAVKIGGQLLRYNIIGST
jgi:hypothetical protein